MRTAALLLLVACGSEPAMPDARPDVVLPRCDPNAPFQAPVPVAGLNTDGDDVCARLSPDELSVVFARRKMTAPYDLYTASRPARDAPFETPALIATVNSINTDVWPTLSPDGLLLVLDSDRSTSISHIHVSKRAQTTSPFGPASAAPALMDREEHPYLANGRALYFSSTRAGGQGMRDIWRTEIDSTGATSAPTEVLGGINTPDDEITAALTADELRIFFRRTTDAEPDIYMASRTTANDGFGSAMMVPGVSMPGVSEVPNWISPDGCSLYLHMNVPGGSGGEDIWVARRGDP